MSGCADRSSRFPHAGLLRHEAAEDAEVRRILPRARARHVAHPLAQREPIVRLKRLQFTIGVQPHLRHVAEEIENHSGGVPAQFGIDEQEQFGRRPRGRLLGACLWLDRNGSGVRFQQRFRFLGL
jgi:hypothetical protein